MARTAKIEPDKRKEKPLPDLSAGTQSNEPTRDDALFMMGQFIAAKDKIKEAQRLNKRIRQRAKNMGFNLTEFDRAIVERERQDTTTLDNLRDFKKYCEFFDLPIGYQFDLLDKPKAAKNGDVEARAERDGYERGIMGKSPDDQAYPPMTPEGQAHMKGWHSGQKVNLDKFVKLNEEFAAEEAAKKAKAAKKGGTTEGEQDGTKH